MLVYSTKSLRCKGDSEKVVIKCHKTTEVPDWVAKTDDFKLALDDGCISILNTKKKKSAAENGELNK